MTRTSTTLTTLTTHIRNDELERERQAARGGDEWAARGMTTDDDIDEGNGL